MAECGRKTKACRACGHKYPKAEHDLDACPECGEERKCRRPAMANGACYLHGGASPKGLAHPRYKTGKWSKYMPQRMLPRYEESQVDTELLALRADIALVDARIADLLEKVDSGESGQQWKHLSVLRLEVYDAKRRGDDVAGKEALEGILHTIGRGKADSAAWYDVIGLIEQRRKLVESERKRLVEMKQMVTVEESMLLVNAAVHSMRAQLLAQCTSEVAQSVLVAVTEDLARMYSRAVPLE